MPDDRDDITYAEEALEVMCDSSPGLMQIQDVMQQRKSIKGERRARKPRPRKKGKKR